MDIYQKRYLEYQESKKNMVATEEKTLYSDTEIGPLFDIMYKRRSQRLFNGERISNEDIITLVNAASASPSSCNRMAIGIKIIRSKAELELLSELLVGGAGWISKADAVFLLLANMAAYKSPAEVAFMPYLDAGFIAQNIYLASEATGIGACFVNLNVRAENEEEFNSLFVPSKHRFCGAMALGLYDFREERKPHKNVSIKENWSGNEYTI